MSADEIFVLVLVIGSVAAVVAMAVQSRRTKMSSNPPAAEDHTSAKERDSPTARAASGRTTRDRQKR